MNKLQKLRNTMKEFGIDYYIIPSSDAHGSEYVPEYYKGRAYISGFTGSAGTLLVGREKAYMWADGRYFIQAEKQLENTGIELMKIAVKGYPSLEEWIENNINENEVLGFDASVISVEQFKKYKHISKKNRFLIKMEEDLLEKVWDDRPKLPKDKIFIHDIEFSGKSAREKIEEVRKEMQALDVDNYILTSLDDIAWLFNIRGNDIEYNPVTLAYALISKEFVTLYVDSEKIDRDINKNLINEGVTIKEYLQIFSDIQLIKGSVIIDPQKVNSKIYSLINKSVKVKEKLNITTSLKAIKNNVEIKNTENSQVRDGVAMVKFIKWLKDNIGKIKITELSASKKLEEFRSQGENFKGLSFNTIAGYKDHAAMMHYSATEESDYELRPEGLFLIDSGAQYLDGTTDVTRTFVLGELTEEEKRDFTLVLKGNIALASVKFLKGSTGENLDVLARRPLWEYGMDYKCGTGHGVGYFLNVHEGPQGIRQKGNNIALKPGMIITDEPGVYKEGKHGIRTENALIVEKAFESEEMGEFYKFRTIAYVPIDLEGIIPEMLSRDEKQWLNNYHSMVYDKLGEYLEKEEREFLRKITLEI